MPYSDDVQFEGDQPVPTGASIGIVAAENKMAGWLMRRGIAKSQDRAQYILLGIAGAAIVIGVASWFLLQSSQRAVYSPQQVQSMMHSAVFTPQPSSQNRF